ncbi:MAG: hypothetical protein ABI779_20125 [Acidobacteriota bacterium]
MSDLLGFAAFLLLPLIGIGIWRLDVVRRLPLPARLSAALAAGILITTIVMATLSLFGIQWNRTKLFVVLGIVACAGVLVGRSAPSAASKDAEKIPPSRPQPTVPWKLLMLVFVMLTAYGLMTARESAGDLHFFWGPKAVRFFRAGKIDADYLRRPDYQPAHPDYPPLLPLLYAWSHTLSSGTFSWTAAVASTLLFLFGSVFLIHGASGDGPGALLVAATLSYAYAVGFAAGGADPPLIFFETLTLVAVMFLNEERGSDVLAALGLCGAAWTKIEGATFAIAVVLALLLVRRDWKRTLRIAAAPALLLGAWVVFVRVAHLLELYRGAAMDVYWKALIPTLRTVAGTATYELFGLPWIVPVVLLLLARNRRAATLPAVVAVLTLAVSIFFYIHLPDPTWWILASAPRVLLTPLLALLVGALAAWHPRPI